MSEVIEQIAEARPRRFRPYPEYKESGVEWLGKIAVHWEVNRLRSTVTGCQNGVWGDEADGVHDIVCVRVADFDRVSLRVDLSDPTVRSVEPRTAATRLLVCGDLLLEKSGGGDKQPVGALVMYDHDESAVCSNFIARVQAAEGHDPRFLTYLHAALYSARVNTRSIKQSTGIQNLDSASYFSEPVALPEFEEQRAIAAFLDRETAKIDGLVARKERLIELLQEKRTALITRAVTRGLEPNVPMKDSGVEWLGEIPAHWEVKRIRDIAHNLQTGPFGSQLHANEYVAGGYPVINPANLRADRLVADEECTASDAVAERLAHHRLLQGDILFARRGDLGRCGLVTKEEEGWLCGTGCLRLRVRQDVARSNFLIRLLSTSGVADWLTLQSVGATMQNLNTSIIGRMPTLVPPTSEQQEITSFLDRETAKLDALVAKIRKAIDHLREFRTALISAAVTGKIDVREEAQ